MDESPTEPLPDFSKMTVAKLKAELTSRGLSTDGLKKDLLARLIDATSGAACDVDVATSSCEQVDEPTMSAKRGRGSKRSADDDGDDDTTEPARASKSSKTTKSTGRRATRGTR